MKLKYKWSFARDFAAKRYLAYIVSILLCFCALLLFSIAFFSYCVTQYGKWQCNKLLSGGVEHSGMLAVANDEDFDGADGLHNIELFYQKAVQSEIIDAVGDYWEAGFNAELFSPLYDKQKEIMKDKTRSYLDAYAIGKNTLEIWNLHLAQGDSDLAADEDNVYPIYLGADYEGIPIGTSFCNDVDTKYVVKGILKKGSQITDMQTLYNESTLLMLDYSVNVDDKIFIVQDTSSNWATYTVNDAYTMEEAEEYLRQLGKEYNLNLVFGRCKDVIAERERVNQPLIDSTKNMTIYLTISVFLILLCIQLCDVIERKLDFGILFANGCSQKELTHILLLENVRKGMIAIVFWTITVYIVVRNILVPAYQMYGVRPAVLYQVCFCDVLPAVVIFMLLYTVLMSVPPIIMLRRISPVQMIRDR